MSFSPCWVSMTKRRQNYSIFLLTLPVSEILFLSWNPGKGKIMGILFGKDGFDSGRSLCQDLCQDLWCSVSAWWRGEESWKNCSFLQDSYSVGIVLFLVMCLYWSWIPFLSPLLLWAVFILLLLFWHCVRMLCGSLMTCPTWTRYVCCCCCCCC